MKGFLARLRLTFSSFIRVLVKSHWNGILKSQFLNNKTACLILGNGPSLKESIEKYEAVFSKFDIVAVNNFAATEYFTELKPKYFIINASILFLPDEQLNALYLEMKQTMLGNIAKKTSWEMELMVPFVAKKSSYFQQILKENPHIRPIYFNFESMEGFNWFKNFFFNLGFGTPRPHNVIIPAIMNCIYLNYKTIALVGADHSWLKEISVSEDNVALVNQKHFYDENESKAAPMSDFQTRPRRLHEMLHKFMLSFQGYWEIVAYTQSKKVKIYNCSETSMIDAFERKKLTEL